MPDGVVGPPLPLPRVKAGAFARGGRNGYRIEVKGTGLERPAVEGESPVFQNQIEFRWHLSNAEHVEPRVNLPRPLGKAKYGLSPIVHPVP